MNKNSINVYSSSFATIVAELITLPICTIKTNYQIVGKQTTIRQILGKIYDENGIRGFYKASLPSVLSQTFSTSSKYVFYRYLEEKNIPGSNKITNGIVSGIASSWFTHPMDVIRIHWQMNTKILPVIKESGFGVLYRGYSKTLGKVVLGSALFLPLYDSYSRYTDPFFAAFLSSFTSTLIIHPIDYLKSRHVFGKPLYDGWNPRNYYRGLTLNLMRIVPHFTIVMVLIEKINKTLI